ncbi:hypothetical protein Val02_25760 [Virgisporangium aliadipatigenens]|uniref:NERD domain-containing protein n=1 Tax=Virgisporangium aliadipatigenens TaxID=741659 RepID=A0A8J3YKP5_9ACTN|nr:hypothetical protein [Virgisporangium aliadipatigenens]GIJ45690.1 hypothetical protein Val02_25760 [Virgisporangium aliadipatigenens]
MDGRDPDGPAAPPHQRHTVGVPGADDARGESGSAGSGSGWGRRSGRRRAAERDEAFVSDATTWFEALRPDDEPRPDGASRESGGRRRAAADDGFGPDAPVSGAGRGASAGGARRGVPTSGGPVGGGGRDAPVSGGAVGGGRRDAPVSGGAVGGGRHGAPVGGAPTDGGRRGVPTSGGPVSGGVGSGRRAGGRGVPVSGGPVSGVPVSGVPVSGVPVSGAGRGRGGRGDVIDPVSGGGARGREDPGDREARAGRRPQGVSAAHGFDTGAYATLAPASGAPPSWLPRIRRETVTARPGAFVPVGLLGVAGLAVLAITGYGVARWDLAWSLLAALAGIAALVTAARGWPLVAFAGLLVGVVCWSFVARSMVPEAWDLAGIVRLVLGNLAYAVPTICGIVAGTWTDARRSARDSVRVVAERRWFGLNRRESEPQLPALEKIPAARFFALPDGRCGHLVVAGRRVALVGATVWPRGEYDIGGNEVRRDGRPFAPGTDDVDAVVDDLRTWAERLTPVGATLRAFLTVHPASERPGDAVHLDIPEVEGVRVVATERFVEEAGEFLAAEPNLLSVPVLEALLPLLAPPEPDADDAGPR